MPVQLGAPAQANFEEPLKLLQDCHRRIEHFLEVLQRVVEVSSDGTLGDEARRALKMALHYFREAAPRHTMDEEESLFPRLRQCGGEAARAALARVAALEADHVRADARHHEVDAIGMRWLELGRLSQAQRSALKQHLDELQKLYAGHLKVEDCDIFPLAGKSLSGEQMAAIGQEMKARRAAILRHEGDPSNLPSYAGGQAE